MAQFQLSQANDLLAPLQLYKSTHFALDNSYIYDVTANSSHVIVSASNNQIKLYNPENLSIAHTLAYHTEKITKIKPVGEHELFSASLDGQIARWDLRTNSVVQQFKGKFRCVVERRLFILYSCYSSSLLSIRFRHQLQRDSHSGRLGTGIPRCQAHVP